MAWFEESDQNWRLKTPYQYSENGSFNDIVKDGNTIFTVSFAVRRYTHTGDRVLTKTHQNFTYIGNVLALSSNLFVLEIVTNSVHVLFSADLTHSTTIPLGYTPLKQLHVVNNFVWVIEDAASSQTVTKIDPVDNSTTTFTLNYPSKGYNIVLDSTNSKILMDSEYGLIRMNLDGSSQELLTQNGYTVPLIRDDGDVSIVNNIGTYHIYDTGTQTIGSSLFDIPKMEVNVPYKMTTDGVNVSFYGLEKGQFNDGNLSGIIFNTTQTPASASTTKYLALKQKSTGFGVFDVNPNAIYHSTFGRKSIFSTHSEDVENEVTISFFNSVSIFVDGEFFNYSFNQERISLATSFSIDKGTQEPIVRPNATAFLSQCSFNGV